MTSADAGTGVGGARRRLHPLTPLLRSARALAVIMAAISWQGYSELGLPRWLGVVVVVLLGALVLSALSWWVTGYQVIGRELRIVEGVLRRRHRSIPLERLQAVDLVQPVLARLVGLAELRLEVIGARRTEAPLAFLTVGQAAALRERLLELGSPARVGVPAPPAPPGRFEVPGPAFHPSGPVVLTPHVDAERSPTVAPGGWYPPAGVVPDGSQREVHAVDNQTLLLSQLLTGQVWLAPVATALVVVQFLIHPAWTFVGVASTLTALAGVLFRPVRRILDDWHFRISFGPGGLRLSHGLLETRAQTVPPSRVQAVAVLRPLLWRPAGWLRCRIDVAGYGHHEENDDHVNRLLPVAEPPVARLVVAEVLPGVDLATLNPLPPPGRARLLAPLRQPVLGVGLDPAVVVCRDGLLIRELVLVPYPRIQSVRVTQGPLQRWLRLATVHVDTAGALRAVAHHRDAAEAYALAADLIARARTAREATSRADRTRPDDPSAVAQPPVA